MKKKYIYRNAGGKNTNAQKIWKGSRKKIRKFIKKTAKIM